MKDTNQLDMRLCGLASVLAGVAWSGSTIFNLIVGGTIEPRNTFGATIALASTTLMVFAFIGAYAGMRGQAGLVPLVGAGLGIVGATLLTGVNTVALAKSVGAVQVSRPPLEAGAPGVVSLIAGVFLLGVGAIRAGVYGRWSGVPFVLAAGLLPLRVVSGSLSALAILSASVGFAWIGWHLLSGGAPESTGAGRAATATSSS